MRTAPGQSVEGGGRVRERWTLGSDQRVFSCLGMNSLQWLAVALHAPISTFPLAVEDHTK